MHKKCFLILIVLSVATFASAVKTIPLKVKEGLWETSVTHSGMKVPKIPRLAPEMLAKMKPEQRAQMEAMMKASSGAPVVTKQCITKEKLAKQSAFSSPKQSKCEHKVIASTASKVEVKIHCDAKEGVADGSLIVEAVSAEEVKGTMTSSTKRKGKDVDMNFTFFSKYLGPDCGNIK